MPKHTSGPWSVSGQLIVGPPEPFPNPKAQPMGKTVASVCWDYDGDCGATEYRIKWKDEGEANAALVAAAPELLEALRELVADFQKNSKGCSDGYTAKARAAISKAEGRTA